MEGRWTMSQYDIPDYFVIGIGESHTVIDFVNDAPKVAVIKVKWGGIGVNEIGLRSFRQK